MLQCIRRPRKAERKRIRKQSDGGGAEADGKQRTALERVQEQLGFANEGEGVWRSYLCNRIVTFPYHRGERRLDVPRL